LIVFLTILTYISIMNNSMAIAGYQAGTNNTKEGGAEHFNSLAPAKGEALLEATEWQKPTEAELALVATADALDITDPDWLVQHFQTQSIRIRTKPINARRLFQIYYNLGSRDALFGTGPVADPLTTYPLEKFLQ
jgi:hypothetical protein